MLVLALLTLVAGAALATMILRRRRERQLRVVDTTRARYGAAQPVRGRRAIDDFASLAAFEESPSKPADVEDDAGKICPRCGARYGSHHRFCEHDNSELAALN